MINVHQIDGQRWDSASLIGIDCTVTDTANRAIVALISTNDSNLGQRTISQVERGTQQFTRIAFADDGVYERVEVWLLLNPDIGGPVDLDAYLGGTVDASMISFAVLSNVLQNSQPNAIHQGINQNANPVGGSLTTTVDDCLLLSIISGSGEGGYSPVSPQIDIATAYDGYLYSSYSQAGVAGSKTHAYNNGETDSGALAIVAIAPHVDTPSSHIKKFGGVPYNNIKKVGGVSLANIKKIGGVAN